MKRTKFLLWVLLVTIGITYVSANEGEARLLRYPDIAGDTIVFVYAGDLWTVPADGGTATRLTSHEGIEQFPKFCPDGSTIAFTGQYGGNCQVFTIPAIGGEPKQLTWYPSVSLWEISGTDNIVYGWSPGGDRILFRSLRNHFSSSGARLWSVHQSGGIPVPLPMPTSGAASYSPDGKKIAYNRIMRDFRPWKRYKGGKEQNIWIFDLETNEIEKITEWGGTDNFPMWWRNRIYFNSDRDENARLNIYYYDLDTKETVKVTNFVEYDVKFPSIGDDRIVFENGGYLYVLDIQTGEIRKVTVYITSDRPLTRGGYTNVSPEVNWSRIGPHGNRVVMNARGEVFTVPAEHGNIRNLTQTPGIYEKYAAWSPDGKWINYISDKSGEEEIYIRPADGKGEEIQLTTGGDRYRWHAVWSPDSKKLAFSDKSNRLFYLTIADKKVINIDEAKVDNIDDYCWSPDSKWLAYSKPVPTTNFFSIYLYSLDKDEVTKLTTDFSIDYIPAFDPGGKYLYFLSARDFNPEFVFYEDNFYVDKTVRPYLITLAADTPSPFAARSDEETVSQEKNEDKAESAEKSTDIRVDLDGIQDRVIGFPVATGDHDDLKAARDIVFWLDDQNLVAFDMKERKATTKVSGVSSFELSADGKKILYKAHGSYYIVPANTAPAKPGDGALNLSAMEMFKDPKAEWKAVFNEAWRRYRDWFYDPDMHGVDWKKMKELYGRLVPYVSHRTDLTYVLSEMVAELCCSHAYVGGGDQPRVRSQGSGLLGCELEPTDSYFKISKIFDGENWHENLRSPLTEPGIDVREGDYLIAIDGTEITAGMNPYKYLVNKTDRTIEITVNGKPSKEGGRTCTVRPIGNERKLQHLTWVNNNLKYVTEKTGGRVGYIHIPDMSFDGLSDFIKCYYWQLGKEAIIVDIRWNSGGFVSKMILERLRRIIAGLKHKRDNAPHTYPDAAFSGPIVCITNFGAGSDGDNFGYFFKIYNLGPLIGTRSWGGVVGITNATYTTTLLDGGFAFVPQLGTYSTEGEWVLENIGAVPDIEVDNLPKDEIAGVDTQLDKAIELILEQLKTRQNKITPDPPFPKK